MADYIDREAVCKRLVEAADVQRKAKSREFAAGMMGAQGVVWMFPTAENVVEVVRCRECKYFAVTKDNDLHLKVSGCYHLKKLGEEYPLVVQGDGYCSWGQRREDGDEDG